MKKPFEMVLSELQEKLHEVHALCAFYQHEVGYGVEENKVLFDMRGAIGDLLFIDAPERVPGATGVDDHAC